MQFMFYCISGPQRCRRGALSRLAFVSMQDIKLEALILNMFTHDFIRVACSGQSKVLSRTRLSREDRVVLEGFGPTRVARCMQHLAGIPGSDTPAPACAVPADVFQLVSAIHSKESVWYTSDTADTRNHKVRRAAYSTPGLTPSVT